MYLSGYDFCIKHQPGKRNPADAPSRRPDYEGDDLAEKLEWLPTLKSKMAKAEAVHAKFVKRRLPMKRDFVKVNSLSSDWRNGGRRCRHGWAEVRCSQNGLHKPQPTKNVPPILSRVLP